MWHSTNLNAIRVVKMLERIVYMQLSDYAMTNKLLGPKQFCYKKGQKSQTTLLNKIGITDYVSNAKTLEVTITDTLN